MATEMESATLGLPDSMESKHPLSEDHSEIVKFDSVDSQGYIQAAARLQDMLAETDQQVRLATVV